MYSTYARIILGLSSGISKSVVKHARQSQSKQSTVLPITILTESQVEQALHHPHNKSLNDLIEVAYTDIVRAQQEVNKGEDNIQDQQEFIEAGLKMLTERAQYSKTDTKPTRNALETQYKLLNHLKNANELGKKQLIEVNDAVNDLVTKQDTEWDAFREKNLSLLSQEVQRIAKKSGLQILEGEIQNLLIQDLQYVLDRYNEYNDATRAEIAQLVGLNKPDFSTYFKMKAYMAFASAATLGEETKIPSMMKELNDFFQQVQIEGHHLNESHEAEINTLKENKVKPILRVATENNMTLKNLEMERTKLLGEQIKVIEQVRAEVKAPEERVTPTPKA